MIRYLITIAVLLISFTAAAEMRVVCDEKTGICQLVEVAEQPETEKFQDDTDGQWRVVRRQLGDPGKEKLLAFLRGDETAAPADRATFWGMLLLALLGGLALNLTPCVLPMLPVNLAIIGANGGSSGFRRGLLYGIGMAVVYGILGILAAFAGLSFGTLNSSPLFNFAIALLFVIMSLAMAGVFNIDLAKYRFNPAGMNFSRDMTALFMGGISALLAGACVAPVVISVLLFAAKANWYGAFVPLALGIGMGLPWPLAGAGLSILPKPGKFMVVMKYIFALIIFAAAIYYTVLGVKLLPAGDAAAQIDGFAALEAAKAESLRTGKPVLVKFTASWCKNCHAMEKTTLRDPEVSDFIKENFIMTTFPAENPEEPGIAKLLKEYDIPGFPALVILKNVPER
ncbi:MAG: thioredoxin family protein [Lentisphaeria bacterium]|nr:thioredoxin family protein [Lentisphaeria bacterium]